MKPTTYYFQGTERECVSVKWYINKGKFMVRRITKLGYTSGILTDRGGWGGPHLAQTFDTAQEASDAAAKTGVRMFQIIENIMRPESALANTTDLLSADEKARRGAM